MPRRLRFAPGGYVFHVLNRAVARAPLFRKDRDYQAFERVLAEAHGGLPTRLVAFCLMPNHWHLVVWPEHDGQLPRYLQWLGGEKKPEDCGCEPPIGPGSKMLAPRPGLPANVVGTFAVLRWMGFLE